MVWYWNVFYPWFQSSSLIMTYPIWPLFTSQHFPIRNFNISYLNISTTPMVYFATVLAYLMFGEDFAPQQLYDFLKSYWRYIAKYITIASLTTPAYILVPLVNISTSGHRASPTFWRKRWNKTSNLQIYNTGVVNDAVSFDTLLQTDKF